jgi:hypothetical protein
MTVFRASLEAITATDTFIGNKRYFLLRLHRFRVMTPDTPEGTPFQKNRGPDSGAIMNRELFYIEDGTGNVTAHATVP